MSGGWARGAWGRSPWGTGDDAGAFELANVYPIASNILRVTFTTPPQARDGAPGSAMNPDLWLVVRQDTRARLYVLSVAQETNLIFDLLLNAALASQFVNHSISANALISASGEAINPLTLGTPGTTERDLSTRQRRLVRRRQGSLDLRSVPTGFNDQISGVLKMTAEGDYALMGGAELVKKLVIRRLVSTPGDFFHLPDYGLGFKVQEPLPSSNLTVLKKNIQRQIMREPEIASVVVDVVQYPQQNMVIVSINAVLKQSSDRLIFDLPLLFGQS